MLFVDEIVLFSAGNIKENHVLCVQGGNGGIQELMMRLYLTGKTLEVKCPIFVQV